MRPKLKNAITIACGALLLPVIAAARLEAVLSKREDLFQFFAEALSRIPGVPGCFMRKAFYLGTVRRCSWTCRIDFGSYFPHRDVSIGERVNIGAYAIIGCVELGDDVMIASRVSITSGRNQHKDKNGAVTHEHFFRTVTIGPRTWIGEGAVVMADVGGDSIVGAGSVVTKNAPANITAVGNPARFIPRTTGETTG